MQAGQATDGSVSIDVDGARLAFSDRALGNVSLVVGGGDIASHRARLAALVGCHAEAMVFMAQVHGADVARVGAADRGRGVHDVATAVPGVDALVTTAPGVAVTVLVADCVPVLLVDAGRAVAAVHAGRRGIGAGVVVRAVAALTDEPARVLALIGPAIGPCCYEVPDTLAAALPDASARTTWGTPSLDLPSAVVAQLRTAGVARVHRAGGCTRCDSGWYSHRAGRRGEGRQAGVAVLAPPRGGASLDLEW